MDKSNVKWPPKAAQVVSRPGCESSCRLRTRVPVWSLHGGGCQVGGGVLDVNSGICSSSIGGGTGQWISQGRGVRFRVIVPTQLGQRDPRGAGLIIQVAACGHPGSPFRKESVFGGQ